MTMQEHEQRLLFMQEVMARFMNDPQFREEMRGDPVGVVERSGMRLSDEGRAMLLSIDWSLPDQELTQRVSKTGYTN